jgi:cyclase
MEIIRIDSLVTVFIRPREGANVGLIHTPQGKLLIDTTSSPAEITNLLKAADVNLDEVRLVINTHSHSDHTWGNQVFSCPILAHRKCQRLMQSALKKFWSPAALQANLAEMEKSDPRKADEYRLVLEDLHIKLPNQVFEGRFEGELGGVKYELIHIGGHTPDTSIAWLPDSKILYASDLIFQGRYPYIFDADVPRWTAALDRLLEFEATTIIPGHGVLSGEAEIDTLRQYLQNTWEQVKKHIRLGHTVDEAINDLAFPVFPGEKYERLHQANIRYMYRKLSRQLGKF